MQNTNKKLPNILFILADDHGQWAMGCAGNKEIDTPNLDRLSATGLQFKNFFCSSPVCSPARATLLTGRIPSQHGIHDWIAAGDTIAKYEPLRNGELIEYLKGQTSYTDILSDSGYSCGISGKWHMGDSHHPQKSFEYWAVHAKGGGSYYNAPMIKNGEVYEEPNYITEVITNNALQWLETRKKNKKPFYLSVHYTAPHSPWSRENHPSTLYDYYYNECPFKSLPDNLESPKWIKHLNIPVESAEKRRKYLSGYYASVTAMDNNIGRLIDWIEVNNLRKDTIIIFTSDNGMNMGHHGVYGKGNATLPLNMFEESVKVPFIISHPGSIVKGVSNHELVSQYDFLPTLLSYTGIDNPLTSILPGKSFANSLHSNSHNGHEHVVVFDEYGPVRMVRTKEWKYIHRYSSAPNELYHIKNDPGEQSNLAGDLEYLRIENEMRQRLTEWFSQYVIPNMDGSCMKITGRGQLGLCGQINDRKAFH